MKVERKGKLPADMANSIRDPDALSAEFTSSSMSGVKSDMYFPLNHEQEARAKSQIGWEGDLMHSG